MDKKEEKNVREFDPAKPISLNDLLGVSADKAEEEVEDVSAPEKSDPHESPAPKIKAKKKVSSPAGTKGEAGATERIYISLEFHSKLQMAKNLYCMDKGIRLSTGQFLEFVFDTAIPEICPKFSKVFRELKHQD